MYYARTPGGGGRLKARVNSVFNIAFLLPFGRFTEFAYPNQTRREQEGTPTRPYSAGFEMSGREARSRGLTLLAVLRRLLSLHERVIGNIQNVSTSKNKIPSNDSKNKSDVFRRLAFKSSDIDCMESNQFQYDVKVSLHKTCPHLLQSS